MDYAPPRSDIRTVPKTLSWQYREDGEFVTKTAEDLFAGKRVVVFAIPGPSHQPVPLNICLDMKNFLQS